MDIHPIQVITTMQGEGPDVGKRMVLVRFKECDRVENKCPCKYCDTLVTMVNSTKMTIKLESIQAGIDTYKGGLMITGGEPGFKDNFDETVLMLKSLKYRFANVETNGCSLQKLLHELKDNNKTKFIYSPKIFTKKELQQNITLSKEVINDTRVYFKIVYQNVDLINKYIDQLVDMSLGDTSRIYLMPEGATRDKLIEHSAEVFDMCEKYKVNFSTRSHIIYGFI